MTDEARTIYERNYADQYPRSTVNVDEQVYVPLDEERHFERESCPIEQHISELREIATNAPDGAEVLVEFEQDYGYDDDHITVRKIGYWRDPTPEERDEREKLNAAAQEHNARLAELQRAKEREDFERLKAKFEG